MVQRLLFALSILLGTLEPAFAKCVPKYALKIVVSFETPEPKTIYRSGERFGRIEDRDQMIVVSEPDIWFVNRADRSGEHAVDAGDSLVFHAPILDTNSQHWNNFEYGCEVPFMRAVGSEPEPIPNSEERVYEHSAEGITTRLTVSKSNVPRRIDVRNGGASHSVIVHAWQELREGLDALFARPEGVRFAEKSEAVAQP